MKKLHYFGFALLALALVFVITYWQLSRRLPSELAATRNGVFFEELIPKEAGIVVAYNPSTAEENARFEELTASILQEKKNTVLPFLATSFLGSLGADITPEELLGVFTKNTRGVFALIDNSTLMLFSVANPTDARTLLKNIYSQPGGAFTPVRDDEKVFYKASKEGLPQAGLIGDVFFILDGARADAENLLARFDSGGSSLSRSAYFKNAFRKNDERSFAGYIFMNFERMAASPLFKTSPMIGVMQWQLATIHAQQGGLGVEMTSVADKKKVQTASLDQLFAPYELGLYKKLPAAGALLFLEGHGLGTALSQQLNALGMADFLDQTKNAIGIDFALSDRASFDEGFAFVLQDGLQPLPALSLYIDLVNAPEKAKKLLDSLRIGGEYLANFVNTALGAENEKPVAEHAAFKSARSEGGTVSLNLSKIPEDFARIPLFALYTSPLELSYGMTNDGIFFISTLPAIASALENPTTLENNALFKESFASAQDAQSLLFIDGGFVSRFIGALMGTIEKLEGSAGANSYEIVKKYLDPLKTYTQFGTTDGAYFYSKGFLKINSPAQRGERGRLPDVTSGRGRREPLLIAR